MRCGLSSDAAVDLQIHTTYSDGHWSPEHLIDYLVHEQFSLVAITDHDRVDSVKGIRQLAAEKQLTLLPAVEMTTRWRGGIVDILCYGFDPDDNYLNVLAQDVTYRQRKNSIQVYENLCRQGYLLAPEQANTQAVQLTTLLEKPAAQQPHEFIALLTQCGSSTEAVKLLLDSGFALAANEIAAVVDAAHLSSAVAVVAHPGRGGEFIRFDAALLDELRLEVPIDGLEAHYPRHTPEQVTLYMEYADRHDLLTSAGSDSHGPDNKPIKYSATTCHRLLERVGIRVN